MSMNTKRLYRLLVLFFVGLVASADAQITIYRDSADFDDVHGRLREIDFEDVYSTTVDGILFRNPYGLHAMTDEMPSDSGTFSDTADVFLWLGQGATLDFPTRTRRVYLDGGANAFLLHVTDFNDSTWTLAADTFPRTIVAEAGIARLQFQGTDGNGNDDINWSGALTSVATFDENGGELASTDFQELYPEHYYLIGRPYPSGEYFLDDMLFGPIEWRGVTFTEPSFGFVGTHLSYFTARVDPDNPIGNLALEMGPEGTIELAEGTEGALLVLEMVRARDSLVFEVTDYAGAIDTVLETGWGRAYDTTWVEDQRVTFAHLAFSSPAGIRSIRLVDAWTTEIIASETGADTAVYPTTAFLAAVYVAEAVPTEIAGISSVVVGLDTAGYVDENESTRLRSTLAAAQQEARAGDRAAAIASLEAFRASVSAMYGGGRLVEEEARLFLTDAAYVISRLGGTASVESTSDVAAPTLSEPWTAVESAMLRYGVRPGTAASLSIVDVAGNVVRSFDVADRPGTLHWDYRDASGARVASGAYFVVLAADGRRVTRAVHVIR
jgi:hypothetical protein